MNQYGTKALKHWQKFLPERFRQLEDPTTFFTELGEETESRIEEVSAGLGGDVPPMGTETYLQKLGRLNMARQNAESQGMQEMALLPPEAKAG